MPNRKASPTVAPLLQQALQQMLPDAELTPRHLPLCCETGQKLPLWLIDPQCLQRRFSPEEELAIQENPAYWAICWPAGHALAAHLLRYPQLVKGKRVIDVGCGSGVVAIAAALAGASEVIASDLDADALLASAENARLNQVRITTMGDFRNAGNVDVLVAADLLYDHQNLWLLDQFRLCASSVMIAESRMRQWHHPHYPFWTETSATTEPDIGQPDEFRQVRFYRAQGLFI
jgi:predicted nicotinamide N-methyase